MSHYFALAFVAPKVVEQGTAAILAHLNQLMRNSTNAGESRAPSAMPWDSWTIGGRYDRLVAERGNEGARLDGEGSVAEKCLQRNLCAVRQLRDNMVPFAVVTPDGQWRTEGQMGYFGQPSHLNPYWEDTYDRLREQYADCFAIGLDCHI